MLILVLCASCSNFLEESNPSNFTSENYFKNADQLRSVVNAIYQDFRMGADGDYGGTPYFMTDFQTGLAGTHVGQNTNINKVRTCTNDADNSYSKAWWNYAYRAIANANLVIAHADNVTMEATEKSKILGEAYCLRAYHYFNLVRLFGSVPLILDPIDSSSPDLYPDQASIETVYTQIISDLQNAENTSLTWSDTSGRVTMGAIKSLLAEVYLTMAGYPLNKGKEYYALAANKAKEVINSGTYSLFESYDDLHNPNADNRGEHILMIQYKANVINNGLTYLYLPYNKDISRYDTEPGSIYAINDFINTYEVGDKRIENQQCYYTQFTLNSDRTQVVDCGNYYIYKFFDVDAHLNTAISGMNYGLLRYADIMLVYAEAQNELDGAPNSLAYDCINQIRERANLADLSGLDQEKFKKAVWTERYHELAFENKIWFDMVRTRKVLNLGTGNFDDYIGHQFTYGSYTLTERELLFPIPLSEINNNRKLIQNSGY